MENLLFLGVPILKHFMVYQSSSASASKKKPGKTITKHQNLLRNQMRKYNLLQTNHLDWLVGCFGFNGPLRQYFSLYRAVSQREGERKEKIKMREKMSKHPPTRTYCKCNRPFALLSSKLVGRPSTESLPSTFTPPNHPTTNHLEDNNKIICIVRC